MAGDDILGPFSQDALRRSTLGPFADEVAQRAGAPGSYARTDGWTDNQSGHGTDRPMLEAMGVTPAEFRSLLDSNPDAKDALSQPEAESLHAYLQGTERYDIHVLNNLFAELTTGFKSRQAAIEKAEQARRTRISPHSPGWPTEGAPPATPGWLAPEGPAETGEPQPPSTWWLESK